MYFESVESKEGLQIVKGKTSGSIGKATNKTPLKAVKDRFHFVPPTTEFEVEAAEIIK